MRYDKNEFGEEILIKDKYDKNFFPLIKLNKIKRKLFPNKNRSIEITNPKSDIFRPNIMIDGKKSKSYKFKLNFQLENIPSDSNNNEPNDIKYQIDSRGKIVNGICINNYDGDDQANDSRRKKFSTINVKNQKEGRSMDKTTTREKTDKIRSATRISSHDSIGRPCQSHAKSRTRESELHGFAQCRRCQCLQNNSTSKRCDKDNPHQLF